MVPFLPLLSCESPVSVKENPDRKKKKKKKKNITSKNRLLKTCQVFFGTPGTPSVFTFFVLLVGFWVLVLDLISTFSSKLVTLTVFEAFYDSFLCQRIFHQDFSLFSGFLFFFALSFLPVFKLFVFPVLQYLRQLFPPCRGICKCICTCKCICICKSMKSMYKVTVWCVRFPS